MSRSHWEQHINRSLIDNRSDPFVQRLGTLLADQLASIPESRLDTELVLDLDRSVLNSSASVADITLVRGWLAEMIAGDSSPAQLSSHLQDHLP